MAEFSGLEGRVDDLSHDGRGVVRVDGKVFFVEGALPSELIRFTRQRRQRRLEIGRLDSIVEASAHRVEPDCKYFGICGGCALQHLRADAQISYKQSTLIENLQRIGHVAPESVLDPVIGPVTGYRRKARLGIRFVPKKGGILVGFRERHKSYITSLDHCLALHPNISILLPGLHKLVASLSCFQSLPQIEVAQGDSHTALIFRHLEQLNQDDHHKLRSYAVSSDVDVYLQPSGLDSVAAFEPAPARPLYYDLPDYDLRIYFEATDFIQVNAQVNQVLIDLATKLLNPTPDDNILELFCGIGNFSLPLASRAGSVVGVEASEMLVRRATLNAAKNGVDNARFITADLYSEQIDQLKTLRNCNKLFLDPPRSGAIEVVRDLVPLLKPESILYVSCNPSTLARDSEILVQKQKYRLVTAGVIDMFPHTAHVESIALFTRSL